MALQEPEFYGCAVYFNRLVLQQQLWFLGLSIQSLPLPWAVTPFTFPYAIAHAWVLGRRAVRYGNNELSLRDPCTLSE